MCGKMRLFTCLLLLVAACGPSDGDVIEHKACPIPSSYDDFLQPLTKWLEADIRKAGLEAELRARPIRVLFPEAEYASLQRAATSGHCERILYMSNGLKVAGYVLSPADSRAKHPVILWARGGSREFGKIEPFALMHMLALSKRGFVVLGTQYRGSDGGEGNDEFGGGDVADLEALVAVARSRPDADAERVFLIGGSRGAMEGLLAIRRRLPVRAAVFRGGMYDLTSALLARPELESGWREMIPEFSTRRDFVLRQRSAINWADEIHVPLLILHGRQDWRVEVAGAEAFTAAVQATGGIAKLGVFEREEHQLAFNRQAWLDAAVEWFKRYGAEL